MSALHLLQWEHLHLITFPWRNFWYLQLTPDMQKTIFQGSDASFQIYVLTHLIAIEISVCVERVNIFIFSAAALM